MSKEELLEIAKKIKIDKLGIAPAEPDSTLRAILEDRVRQGKYTGFEEKDIEKRINPAVSMQEARSVIVCLFPYFPGHHSPFNIAKYAQGMDYHTVIKRKLELLGELIRERIPGFKYQAYTDTGPLVDRHLAYMAGLGYYGVNNCIISPEYGSYVLIGYMINNYPFEPDKPLGLKCLECGECAARCPGRAILGNHDFDPQMCLSYITQKKGDLSCEQLDILKHGGMIFGCDICQDVCPHNKNAKKTAIKEFSENLTSYLALDDLKNISGREFRKKYKNRAFTWRGKSIIERNLKLLNAPDVSNPRDYAPDVNNPGQNAPDTNSSGQYAP